MQTQTYTSASHTLDRIANPQESGPYISLYLPIEADEAKKTARIRFYGLLKKSRKLLATSLNETQVDQRLNSIEKAFDDLRWTSDSRGVAIFSNNNQIFSCVLDTEPPELAVVASSYHIKPLFAASLFEVSCFALAVTAKQVALYKVSRQGVVQLGYTERESIREVDGYRKQFIGQKPRIKESVERFLARAAKRFHKEFGFHAQEIAVLGPKIWRRRLAKDLCELKAIVFYEAELPADQQSLQKLLLNPLQRTFKQRMQQEAVHLATNTAGALLSRSLPEIAEASVLGRIQTLIVDRSANRWGVFDRSEARIALHHEQMNASDDCILDDIIEEVYRHRGEILFVDHKPDQVLAPFLAVLRW